MDPLLRRFLFISSHKTQSMNREKVKRKMPPTMLPMERAITIANGQKRRRHVVLPPISQSKELDVDYLQALKVIDRTRREENTTSIVPKSILRKSDHVQERYPRTSYQFSSTLTPVGQQAMIKTYEDTLISHLTDVYSSKRIGNVLPRLQTAAFRHRLPKITNIHHHNQTRIDNIHQAQNLIDHILNNNLHKDKLLSDYVKWQHQWPQNC